MKGGAYMPIRPDQFMKKRTYLVLISVILMLSIVSGASLFNIMVLKGEKYQSKASEQQLYDSIVTAPRGNIYDSNMSLLATSSSAWTVYITPNGINKLNSAEKAEKIRKCIAENLSKILSLEYDEVYNYTKQTNYYVIVKKKVEKSVADKVRKFIAKNSDLGINQFVGLDSTTKRYYPNDNLASCVLGFVGDDDQGLSGLESYYDNDLTGVTGRVVAAKNAAGVDMPFTYEKVEEAQQGNSLVLTLDSYIQYTCEKYLDIAVEENAVAERGVSIVMNVNDGSILGMAVSGDYNPNTPFTLSNADKAKIDEAKSEEEKKTLKTELLNRQWRNKAVSDTYEPGSVFKIVTASVGLEENIINLNSTFNCSYVMNVAGVTYHCHKQAGHGTQNLAQAISNSCNPAFITIGQLIGAETFSKYFKAFGLTEKTGVDLPGEATSTYHAEKSMGPAELSSSSFGQTFNVTSMQLISAVAAAVNGGYLVQPHLVSKIVDKDNKVIERKTTNYKRQVISKSTSETMRGLLNFVSQNGVKNALVAGYNIGAKSGTSQKISKILATGNSGLYVGSCLTVAPIEKPEIVVLTLLDEPTGGQYYGGTISAPVCSKIMADILPYLGYEPQYTEDELKTVSISVPDVIGNEIENAKETVSHAGLNYRIIGNGAKVIKQLPESGNSLIKGGTVILYTDESDDVNCVVPNLTGLSATEANNAAHAAGINIELSGNNENGTIKSYRQSVAAGTTVPVGSIVTVYFRDENGVDMAN